MGSEEGSGMNTADLSSSVGSDSIKVPPCLADYWSEAGGGPNSEEDVRKLIAVFAMYHRDHLVGKEHTKKALIEWSAPFISKISDNLVNSEVDKSYESEQSLSCSLIKESVLAKYCEAQMCDYPRNGPGPRAWHSSNGIKIEEVCEISSRRDGSQAVKFSPDKAAATIVKEYSIVSTPDERIWIYQDGIYKSNGDVVVDQILDKLVGDLYNSRAASETHRKIVLRTLKEYSVFDGNPYLFCILNGVVDMQNGRFMKHDPGLYLTSKAPIIFDSKATCPEIEGFLGSALGTEDNVLSFLDIMTAKTTDLLFEYFVALIGGGSNGKTIAEELIRAFFGDDTIAEVDLCTLTQNRFDRREIYKKKFLINSEVSGDVKESRWIKYISGGGRIDADQKGKEHIQFRPRCLVIFDTNNPPRFADSSYAFQRRLVKIDFPNTFVDVPSSPTERRRDPFLLRKMTSQQELSGLLNLLMLRARDVLPEKRIYRRTDGATLANEYDMQANSLQEFFDKFVDFDSGLWITKSGLYEHYKDFCKHINAVPKSQRELNKYAIKNLRLEEARKDIEGAGRARIFWGIELDKEALDEFINPDQDSTGKVPEISISRPGLPTLPSLKRIVDRIVYSNRGNIETQKNPVFPVNVGPDSEIPGTNPTDKPGQNIEDELKEAERKRKEHEKHFETRIISHTYAPDGRDLDEEGEWEDCEICGLPLPPSWQNKIENKIYCSKCRS